MLTIITPPWRVLGLLLTLLFTPGCGRILGIEGAHVDPILDEDEGDSDNGSDGADDSNDETDTVGLEPHNDEDDDDTDTPPDASNEVDPGNDSDDTTAECVSFDNRRVPRLNADGTLTPLPELDDAVR